jgi:hypothetical protein
MLRPATLHTVRLSRAFDVIGEEATRRTLLLTPLLAWLPLVFGMRAAEAGMQFTLFPGAADRPVVERWQRCTAAWTNLGPISHS